MSAALSPDVAFKRLTDLRAGARVIRAGLVLRAVSPWLQGLLAGDDEVAQLAAEVLEANRTARLRMAKLVTLLANREEAAIDREEAAFAGAGPAPVATETVTGPSNYSWDDDIPFGSGGAR